jgi:hypothetical protein
LSSSRSIKPNVGSKLSLFSSKIGIVSSLGGIDLDTENLSGELEDLVLYFAVLIRIVSTKSFTLARGSRRR